ncbi:hypothetical protein ACFW6C_19030 [Streptomyces fungicidicus]|uniref:hypothetical protein n=1 Tax=Streptomyces fungicidicus TaxID=68203 RepID=UPI003696815E
MSRTPVSTQSACASSAFLRSSAASSRRCFSSSRDSIRSAVSMRAWTVRRWESRELRLRRSRFSSSAASSPRVRSSSSVPVRASITRFVPRCAWRAREALSRACSGSPPRTNCTSAGTPPPRYWERAAAPASAVRRFSFFSVAATWARSVPRRFFCRVTLTSAALYFSVATSASW